MILVTGGTGLVGSHLLYKLVSNGQNVRAIYRREKTLKRVAHVFGYFSDNAENLFNLIIEIIRNKNKLEKIRNNMKKSYNKNVYSNIENELKEFI